MHEWVHRWMVGGWEDGWMMDEGWREGGRDGGMNGRRLDGPLSINSHSHSVNISKYLLKTKF